ncbi:hypothetical protein GALMADRAFT_147495 [Galerina marginata CBS 339.88]|uniref:Uncharacterized protein n=1 Tax=Galerina marginata (strain CBS 339.88) TaxID=685588 RepID=A0A067S872_GALM3|nr:hypothetical protein GALMADRAFT_147495 [Galerina marginata CBS 339.88]
MKARRSSTFNMVAQALKLKEPSSILENELEGVAEDDDLNWEDEVPRGWDDPFIDLTILTLTTGTIVRPPGHNLGMAEGGPRRNVADKSWTNSKQKKGDETQIEAQEETSIGTRDFATEREHVSDSSSPARSPSNRAKSTALKRKQRADSDEYETDETQSSSEEDSIMSDHDLPRIKLRSQGMNSSRPRTKVGSKSGRETVVRVAKKTGSEVPPRNLAYVLVPPSPHKSQALSPNPSRPLADYRDSVELTDGQHSDDLQPDNNENRRAVSTRTQPSKERKTSEKEIHRQQATDLALFKEARLLARQETKAQLTIDVQALVDASKSCGIANVVPYRCKILEVLGINHCNEIDALLCSRHGVILPVEGIVPHLTRRHKLGFRESKLSPEHVLQHLHDIHGDTLCKSTGISSLPSSLNTQLAICPELKSVRYRYYCPQPQCNMWITRNDTYPGGPEAELYSHLSKEHDQKIHPKNVTAGWCQANYTPTEYQIEPSFPTKIFHASSTSTWFRELKWPEFRLSLQKIPYDTLQRLVAPPSRQIVSSAEGASRSIEAGLLLVRKALTEYLRNGQRFISSIHGSFRVSLSPRDEKYLAEFRVIEDANIVHYRGPLLKVISMLMRLVILSKANERNDRKVAELLLKGDHHQLAEADRLFSVLKILDGKPKGNNIQIALHRLLKSLLCPESLPDVGIDCPTDVFLFLASLSGEGFRPAASVKNLCCKMQFNFRIVYLHVARIDANNGFDYTPFADPSTEAQDSDSEESDLESDDEDDGEDDDGVDDDDILHCIIAEAEKMRNEIHAQSVDAMVDAQDNLSALSKAFEKFQPYILQGKKLDFLTPFQRNTQVWKIVALASRKEPIGAQLNVTMLDGSVKVSHASDVTSVPKSIRLQDWALAAQTCIVEFQNHVERLLPCGVSASEFPLESVSDDLCSPISPHRQDQNFPVLGTWSKNVLLAFFNEGEKSHKIMVDGHVSSAAAKKWLITEQNTVLTSLVKVLALCCGIGIQEYKYKSICFDSVSSSSASRNVWMLKNGLIAFSDPVKVLGAHDDSTRFFSFPRDMTRHLALYLYVIRPLGAALIVRSHQDIPYYESHLWANIHRPLHGGGKNPWLWSGTKISKLVQVVTHKSLGVALSPALIQRIESNLFSKYLPGIFLVENLYSPVDQQAQHTKYTSLSHYGWVSHFPPIRGLRVHQPARHLAISEIWHAMLNLGPINEGWKNIIVNSALTKSLVRHDEAKKLARRWVLEQYEVQSPRDALSLLETLPFILDGQKTQFGDGVLERITGSLLSLTPTSTGCSQAYPTLEDVTEAAIISPPSGPLTFRRIPELLWFSWFLVPRSSVNIAISHVNSFAFSTLLGSWFHSFIPVHLGQRGISFLQISSLISTACMPPSASHPIPFDVHLSVGHIPTLRQELSSVGQGYRFDTLVLVFHCTTLQLLILQPSVPLVISCPSQTSFYFFFSFISLISPLALPQRRRLADIYLFSAAAPTIDFPVPAFDKGFGVTPSASYLDIPRSV